MAQDGNKQKTSFINIPQLLKAYCRNWKWVAASVIVFLALGTLVYLRQAKACEVSAQLLISDEGSKATASISEVASMFGGGGSFGANRSVEDEMVIIKAHSLLKETVEQLEMNVGYVVRKNWLKKYNAYYNQPVKLIYDKNIADTLGCVLTFKIKVNEKGITEVTIQGPKNKVIDRKKDLTLPARLDTPYGQFTLVEGNGFVKGKDLDERITLMSYDNMALALDKLINVDYSAKKTDIMLLNFITTDARYGKSVLNTLVENYNKVTIEQKREFNRKTLEFIEDRIAILSAEVDSTQAQVESFMGRRDLVNPEAQAGIYIQRTSHQEVELAKAEAEYELLNMAIEFLSNEANNTSMLPIMPSTASLTPLIEGYNQLILDRLSIESSAKGSNMALKAINTRINAVRDNLLTALNKQAETADVEISEMRRQYAKNKKRLDTMPGIEREFVNITRQQSLKEQLYVYLLRQREETEMAIAGAHPRGVIIDEAYITDTVLGMSPKIVLFVFLILGLFLPAAFILMKWITGRHISIPDQAVQLSGNREFIARISLSALPQPAIMKEPTSEMARGIRLLRSNTMSLDTLVTPFVTTVIGTVDNDDAPCVAFNYASSMALTGHRTVLVEANPFRHSVSGLLGITPPGEITFDNLSCEHSVSTITLDSKGTQIDFMQCALDERFGDDLIESVGFGILIDSLREDYEIIVISAPSIGSYYPAVERLNGMSDLSLVTVGTGRSAKKDVSKVSRLIPPVSGGLYLVETVYN